MSSLSATISQGCSLGSGFLSLSSVTPAPGAVAPDYFWTIIDSSGTDFGGTFDPLLLPISVTGLANGNYNVRVRGEEPDGSGTYISPLFSFAVSCSSGGSPGALTLESLSKTDETAALSDGTATIQASDGTPPLTAELVELSMTLPATSGAPTTFTGLAPATYTLRVTDSSSPAATVSGTVTIAAYAAPVSGCQDEYAADYDPAATVADACTYAVSWRSAWGPAAVAVRVPAVVGQVDAFATALLRLGFRAGHPNATDRPLGTPLALRATLGPDGYATFRLGPFLRAALGSLDGNDYRLDLNSATAAGLDLYTGFELRAASGELLSHGYAVNAAVPDAVLAASGLLSPFAGRMPVWPGFDDYLVPYLSASTQDRFGLLENDHAYQFSTVMLPCPANPVPVAWLAPGGGFGYWLFQGRPQLGDDVGDSQAYTEAGSGERRYSQRGEARRTVSATTGVFKGLDLLEGLRTLWASPQVWYQPVAGGPWVPVTIEGGSFPAGRVGINRQSLPISFTEAQARYAQGQ